jgi:hypothetical protein
MTIVSSAAGCLQNISREDESRVIIQDNGGVPLLTELLFMDQLPAQTCAAGALLNVQHSHSTNMLDIRTRFGTRIGR